MHPITFLWCANLGITINLARATAIPVVAVASVRGGQFAGKAGMVPAAKPVWGAANSAVNSAIAACKTSRLWVKARRWTRTGGRCGGVF